MLTTEQLAGAYAKLERADENIRNLKVEISAFLQEHPAGGLPEDKNKALDEWVDFHAKRVVPPRFGILAGEIAHHLRSSFDHVMWQLSTESYRRSNERDITFPIFTERPTTKNKITSYQRKVQGITSAEALQFIESIQPYNAGNPLDDPLAIIHDLNRVDKHQEIVLVVGTFDLSFFVPFSLFSTSIGRGFLSKVDPENFPEEPAKNIEIKLTKQVAFKRFGQRENQTVIPALTHLANAARNVVKLFTC
jgi:hypothetical protein